MKLYDTNETEDLWTLAEAREAAKAGMEQAAETCGDPWLDYAHGFILDHLDRRQFLHVDDLWETGLDVPANLKGLGQVIARLKREGHIQPIRIANIPHAFAARPSVRSNGQVKLVWKSMRYRGPMREAGELHELLADMREALTALMPSAPDKDAVAKLIVRAGGQP
jgi:hypothetical protein